MLTYSYIDAETSSDKQIEQISQLFLQVFQDEAVVSLLIKSRAPFKKGLFDVVKAFFYQRLLAGHMLLTAQDQGEIIGFALIHRPEIRDLKVLANCRFTRLLRTVTKALPHLNYLKLVNLVNCYPLDSSWRDLLLSIELLGVSFDYQGRGVGRHLLNKVLTDWQDEYAGFHLTTGLAQTCAYYSGFGFDLIGQTCRNKLTVYEMVRLHPMFNCN
ncbi:hypothetical protein AWM75_00770 [Aerococcus urinaehominis]|uniref:Uncharacterized protein n=1 Tax=Aerococcus urinaehominis TaxID=128944 RepID=A0A0X8FK78_9LACT|nr:GNAT family N-acetyltransferase [Aerococcus urinaehominis]AMB98614.1 hypothetical protein AWM75_00770 [Aerococcus urinaehominis]SDL95314.1 Acetyltransferase (GNAT) family protein [Aerococcus urinaehominis]